MRDNMATLVIHDLPRPTPDALHRAGAAWRAARAATRRALGLPLSAGVVAVAAPAGTAVEPA